MALESARVQTKKGREGLGCPKHG